MKKRLAYLFVAAAFLLSSCSNANTSENEQTSGTVSQTVSAENEETAGETQLSNEESTDTNEPQPAIPNETEPGTIEVTPSSFTDEELETQYLYLSGEEQNIVSKNKNIITLILDAVDMQYVTSLLKNKPSAFNGLEDFTMYTNTCSVFDSTFQSLTQIYAGYDELPTYQVSQWNEDAWSTETAKEFYNRFHKAGYKMNFYVDADWELTHLVGKADNLALADEPLGDYYDPAYGSDPINHTDFSHFNPDFSNMVSTMQTAEDEYNYFIVQHLRGAHLPLEKGSFTEQLEYLLDIVRSYLDNLKEFGVYDDATIIIMADHGSHDLYTYPNSTPLFMIKEPNAHSDKMNATSAPIYFTDLMSTYLINAGLYDAETDKDLFGSSIYDFSEGDERERTANYRRYDGNYPYSKVSPVVHSYGYNVIYSYTYTGNSMNLLKAINDGNPVISPMEEDAG